MQENRNSSMTHDNILRLEDMQNMTIDQIVDLYRSGYSLEDSNVKIIPKVLYIKSMQQTSSISIAEVLILGFVSSFAASYIFYNYYRKKQKFNQ